MADLGEIEILMQLIDNLSLLTGKLESSYGNMEEFNRYKKEMLKTQEKIAELVKI